VQKDNDLKNRSKCNIEWLSTEKTCLLEWSSQSLDLMPTEMQWNDHKRAAQTRHPENMAELKQFCEIQRSKDSPERCAGATGVFV